MRNLAEYLAYNNHQSLLVISGFNFIVLPLKEEETEALGPHICWVWKKAPWDLNHILFLQSKILDTLLYYPEYFPLQTFELY